MNTFFRICVFFCLSLIIFSLTWNFVYSLQAFEIPQGNIEAKEPETLFSEITDFEEGTGGIFVIALTSAMIIGLFASWMTKSPVCIGLSMFGVIFWASYLNTLDIIRIGGYLPTELELLFTGGMIFIFSGAVIGMLTGSG